MWSLPLVNVESKLDFLKSHLKEISLWISRSLSLSVNRPLYGQRVGPQSGGLTCSNKRWERDGSFPDAFCIRIDYSQQPDKSPAKLQRSIQVERKQTQNRHRLRRIWGPINTKLKWERKRQISKNKPRRSKNKRQIPKKNFTFAFAFVWFEHSLMLIQAKRKRLFVGK